jgi:hypothetical protein
MFTMKRLMITSALTIGAVIFLASPNTANADPKINIGIGIGPVVRPVPYPIVRPVPAPIVYPSYPVLRPTPIFVPPVHGHHHYDVLYRDCSHDPWRVYGRFDSRWEAERVSNRLERHGNQTFIKTIHHHR